MLIRPIALTGPDFCLPRRSFNRPDASYAYRSATFWIRDANSAVRGCCVLIRITNFSGENREVACLLELPADYSKPADCDGYSQEYSGVESLFVWLE